MKVAVITPFADEPTAWLEAMQRSVISQTHPCTHIMVSDGPRQKPPLDAMVIQLPEKVGDFGDTPRCVGSLYAAGKGFDAIAYLDADNGYDADHIANAVQLHLESGAAVVTSGRKFVSLDGWQMAECLTSDGEHFCDTNCLFITKAAFDVLATWALMDPAFHPIDDRVLWHAICQGNFQRSHTGRSSVSYRATHASVYRDLGLPVPDKLQTQKTQKIAHALKAWDDAGKSSVRHVWRYRRVPAVPDPVLHKSEPFPPNTQTETLLRFHPDAVESVGSQPLMGRHVAGETFLRAMLQSNQLPKLTAQVSQSSHRKAFLEKARQYASEEAVQVVSAADTSALLRAGVLHHLDPALANSAWARSLVNPMGWSLTGITHSTASLAAVRTLQALLTAPLHPWDALVCPSTAVLEQVAGLLDQYRQHLSSHLGCQQPTGPQLRHIPLGIHSADFAPSLHKRAHARQQLGLRESDRVVLYLGRLSFHAKAHPLPMYSALQAVAHVMPAGNKLVLIECGWHAHAKHAEWFEQAATTFAPGLEVIRLDGRNAQSKAHALAAADLFCSLADNIQESFGITPLEAMAAGLPVVVSDWNGYKDTVRQGVDGFLIPTTMPPPGLGRDLAWCQATGTHSYDRFTGLVGSFVAVHIPDATQALAKLVLDPDMSRQMGRNAMARMQADFDWQSILPRYRDLWAELADVRRLAAARKNALNRTNATLNPAVFDDPFASFQHYASHPLTRSSQIRRATHIKGKSVDGIEDLLNHYESICQLHMVQLPVQALPSGPALRELIRCLPNVPTTVGTLLDNFGPSHRAAMHRALVWLLKLGLVEVYQSIASSPICRSTDTQR